MNIITHAVKQPFVLATGVAALVHSTWALGTLFAGEQPADIPHLVGWLVPAFLIAFALDVGQIVTSAEIRAQGLTWQRTITFTVFAGATYYLQWLYIAHHMPALDLAAGVRPEWAGLTGLIRDAALWAIPALLPLSTLLYTLSSNDKSVAVLPESEQLKPITIAQDENTLPAPVDDGRRYLPGVPVEVPESDAGLWKVQEVLESVKAEQEQEHHAAECPACGWSGSYKTATSARLAYNAHRRHCKAINVPVSSNGHGEGE